MGKQRCTGQTPALNSKNRDENSSFQQTWYLFCKAAAEETLVLTVANKQPKEGVKTEIMLI